MNHARLCNVTPMLLAVLMLCLPAVTGLAQKQSAPDPVADLGPFRDQAIQTVVEAFQSDRAEFRAHALEAIQHAPDRALPLVHLGLNDESAGVRFMSVYLIGKLEMETLLPAAKDLIRDPRPDVQSAVIYAFTKCGKKNDKLVSKLAEFVQHASPGVRANTVMLMGELGDDTAVPMLRRAGIRPSGDMHPPIRWALLRVQAAEALAKLGDARGLDSVRSAAYSGFDEVRILSVQTIGKLGDQSFWANLNNFLVENPIEFRLAAAEALARLGRERGGMMTVMGESATHELATVRSQAALALGRYDRDLARGYLVQLLNDPDPMVQLSAAAAVLEATTGEKFAQLGMQR